MNDEMKRIEAHFGMSIPELRKAEQAQLNAELRQAMDDYLATGTGVMQGSKRIDPKEFYAPPRRELSDHITTASPPAASAAASDTASSSDGCGGR